MKILHLSLKKDPFEVMVTGEKNIEFRNKTNWIEKRLFNSDGSKKNYDCVKFTNGYGNNRPNFLCKYYGFFEVEHLNDKIYSNGLIISSDKPLYCIKLGKPYKINNYKFKLENE